MKHLAIVPIVMVLSACAGGQNKVHIERGVSKELGIEKKVVSRSRAPRRTIVRERRIEFRDRYAPLERPIRVQSSSGACKKPLRSGSDVAIIRNRIRNDLKQQGFSDSAVRIELASYDSSSCHLR